MSHRLFRWLLSLLLLTVIAGGLKAQAFFKTPSGKKYHLGSCRMVENVSQEITLEQAARLGLGPCKICRPTTASQHAIPQNTPRGKEATVQCKGMTKAGTRCRHMTSIANGYCYPHNPDKKR